MSNADTLRKHGYIYLLLAVTLLAPLAKGQNANSGEVRGLATDSSDAIMTDVTIVLANVQTGVSISTKTNGSGIYDVPSV